MKTIKDNNITNLIKMKTRALLLTILCTLANNSYAFEQSVLNFTSFINADSLEAIEIDKAHFSTSTIVDVSITYYEGGYLHDERDTILIYRCEEIHKIVQSMRQLKPICKSDKIAFDTRGRISLIYKNGKRENCYFSRFFLFGSDGNLYSIERGSPSGSTLRNIILSYFNHDDY